MTGFIIRTENPSVSSRRYEAFPPWLASMVVHMVAVIALGMLHIGLEPGLQLSLMFAPDDSDSSQETEIDGLTELAVDISGSIAELASFEGSPDLVASNELLTSLETDWEDFVSTESSFSPSAAGFSDGALISDGGGGGKVKTSLFGLEGEGGKFVYVFDRSASMLSTFTLYSGEQFMSSITPLDCAKLEMTRSLSKLSGGHRFQIVFYNHAPWLYGDSHYADKLFAATPDNKRRANAFIKQMPAEGFTNHLLALEAAIELQPDVIFLLTDGEAKDDLHPDVVRRMSRFCQRRNITVNIVHFSHQPRPECTLIPLAEKTGGQHLFLGLETVAEMVAKPMAMHSQ